MEDERDHADIALSENDQRITPSETPYEQMCVSLYAYRYGAIGFLELIATFEESLGLIPPQTGRPTTLKCEKMLNE